MNYYVVYYKHTKYDLTWKKHTEFTTRARAIEVAKKMVKEGSVEKTKVVKE